MIYSSLAVLAMSASALMPLSNPIHLHPKASDTRVEVTLYNNAVGFRDVKIDGHLYTVMPHQALFIKAAPGVVVYTDSRTLSLKRGDAILTVTEKLNHQRVNLD